MSNVAPPTDGHVSRRAFLQGLTVALFATGLRLVPRTAKASELWRANAFVSIAPNGDVSIVCHRSEMGQGVRSSLPVLIADEMGADLRRVKVVQGDGDSVYGDQNTDGSSSVRDRFTDLRRVGATVRTLLETAASKRWKIPPAALVCRDHAVHHPASGRVATFAELVQDAARLPLPNATGVRLRALEDLPHLGNVAPLVDAHDIVTGKAVFAADVHVDGMLTAVIARPAVVGGKVVSFDASQALAVAGVKKVFMLPPPRAPYKFQPLGGVVVVADSTWAAMRGRAVLDIVWDDGVNAAYDSESYRQKQVDRVAGRGKTVRDKGDVDAALAAAAKHVDATYCTPHLAHASMEPPAALAHVQGARCEVWACTQSPQTAAKEVADALGFAERDVTMHVTLLGGAFGRKSKPDFIIEAALVSRAVGAPVRLQWTRDDDVRHDYYHSTAVQRLVGGIDTNNTVTAWQHRITFPPIDATFTGTATPSKDDLQQGVLDVPLHIANVRAEIHDSPAHTRIGWLRSVANIYHAFAVQSFIDELAHARGMCPRDNLLDIIGPARHVTEAELGVHHLPNYGASLDEHPIDTARLRAVVERVCAASHWDGRKQSGRALGLAVHRSFLTYVAVVISARWSAHKTLQVDEAWIVADAGVIINRDRVLAQLEGAVIFGLSLALHGAITMKRGATQQSSFFDYRILRMAEAPRAIHAEIIPSSAPPGGIGEPGVPPVAPALANAVFALTGKRARTLPIGTPGLA